MFAAVPVKGICLDRLTHFWTLGCSREVISAEDSEKTCGEAGCWLPFKLPNAGSPVG